MRNILLITGLLVLSIVLRAQNIQLSGVVKDRTDSSALIGANVAIKSLPDSITIAVVSTNADGAYKIGDIKPGSYLIQSTFVGYKTYKRVVELGINPQTNITILMAGDGITLEGVEIIGRTPPVTQKATPQKSGLIPSKLTLMPMRKDLVTKMPGITRLMASCKRKERT